MTLEGCIPKDKFDIAAVDRAKHVGFPALNPVLPDLLVWLQDMNWPVAEGVAVLLANAGEEILPPIREILSSNDGVWKYWVLTALVPSLHPQVSAGLRTDLARLAEHPTYDDRHQEVDQAARGLIDPC